MAHDRSQRDLNAENMQLTLHKHENTQRSGQYHYDLKLSIHDTTYMTQSIPKTSDLPGDQYMMIPQHEQSSRRAGSSHSPHALYVMSMVSSSGTVQLGVHRNKHKSPILIRWMIAFNPTIAFDNVTIHADVYHFTMDDKPKDKPKNQPKDQTKTPLLKSSTSADNTTTRTYTLQSHHHMSCCFTSSTVFPTGVIEPRQMTFENQDKKSPFQSFQDTPPLECWGRIATRLSAPLTIHVAEKDKLIHRDTLSYYVVMSLLGTCFTLSGIRLIELFSQPQLLKADHSLKALNPFNLHNTAQGQMVFHALLLITLACTMALIWDHGRRVDQACDLKEQQFKRQQKILSSGGAKR